METKSTLTTWFYTGVAAKARARARARHDRFTARHHQDLKRKQRPSHKGKSNPADLGSAD